MVSTHVVGMKPVGRSWPKHSQAVPVPPLPLAGQRDTFEVRLGAKTKKQASSPSINHRLSQLGRHTLIGLSLIGPAAMAAVLASPQPVEAAVSKESERVVAKVFADWNAMTSAGKFDVKDRRWQHIRPMLYVGAHLQESDLDPIRLAILRKGGTNPDIPIQVLQDAIVSAGIRGSLTKDEAVKKQLSQILGDYRRLTLVEYPTEHGRIRRLITQEELNGYKYKQLRKSNKLTEHTAIQEAAMYATMSIGHPQTIQHFHDELATLGINAPGEKELLQLYSFAPPQVKAPMPALLNRLYGEGNFRDYQTYMTDKKAGKSVTEPTTSNKTLSRLPSHLLTPVLPELKTDDDKARFAQLVQIIASRADYNEQAHPVLPALGQYFALHSGGSYTDTDAKLLGILADKAAKKDVQAFDLLKRVINSHPKLFASANIAFNAGHNSTKAQTGVKLIEALRANPHEDTRKLLLGMARRESSNLLWKSSLSDERAQKVLDQAQEVAMVYMASRPHPDYAQTLRQVFGNPDHRLNQLALVGLTRLQDKSIIPDLLDIVANPNKSLSQRELAAQSVLKIVGNPEIPQWLRDKHNELYPFNADLAVDYFKEIEPRNTDKNAPASVTLQFNPSVNPYKARMERVFQSWLAQEKALRKASGDTSEVTRAQKEAARQQIMAQEFAGSRSHLVELGKSKAFRENQLAALHQMFLNREVTPDIAYSTMQILGAARYAPAADTLAKMSSRPLQFFNLPLLDEYEKTVMVQSLRKTALQSLGGVVDPADEAKSRIFYQYLDAPSILYKKAAITGLRELGDQIGERLADITQQKNLHPERKADLEKEEARLEAARKAHVTRLLKSLDRIEETRFYHEDSQGGRNNLRYLYSRALAKLGGGREVAQKMAQTWSIAEKMERDAADHQQAGRKELAMSATLEALRYKDRTRDMANGLMTEGVGQDIPIVRQFAERHYAQLHKLREMGVTGKGAKILIFDYGFVVQLPAPKGFEKTLPALQGKVQYAPWTRFTPDRFKESHPTGVAYQALQFAPDADLIYSYSWKNGEGPDTEPYVTSGMQTPYIQSMIHALVNQMRPNGDPQRTEFDVANNSWEYYGQYVHDKEVQEQLNLSAYLNQALRETGVTIVIAAGNGQDRSPSAVSDTRGSVNPLGDFVDQNGISAKVPGTLIFSAVDGVLNTLARYAGLPDVGVPEGMRQMFTAPGDLEMTLYYDDVSRDWALVPVRGTSFGAPSGAGGLAAVKRERERAGHAPWTVAQEEQALVNASAPLPRRQPYEGLLVDWVKLVEQARKAVPDNMPEATPVPPPPPPPAPEVQGGLPPAPGQVPQLGIPPVMPRAKD